jgi:hypothetical protein
VWWVVRVGVLLVGGSRRWKTRSECCSQESSGSASTREANKSVSQAEAGAPLCNQACPEIFPRLLCHHSHVSCSKTFLTTFFFNANVEPCLLFADITRHVKTTMKEIYSHHGKKPDTQLSEYTTNLTCSTSIVYRVYLGSLSLC